MPRYILALDQGTTSSRAILFDRDGRAVSVAQQEFPQIYPRAGWVEHDPEAIWSSQLAVAKQAIANARTQSSEIAAIGITNQRETTIVWDRKTDRPIHNAIVWQCRRTAPVCERLRKQGFDRTIRRKTGLVTDAYFSGTKVAWLLDNVKGARRAAAAGELSFGTVDTWLINRLSAGQAHVTDPSTHQGRCSTTSGKSSGMLRFSSACTFRRPFCQLSNHRRRFTRRPIRHSLVFRSRLLVTPGISRPRSSVRRASSPVC